MSGHITERARERYGIELAGKDIRRVADQCRDFKGVLVKRDHYTQHEVWLAWHGATALVVVYDRKHNRIKTVLPPDFALTRSTRNKRQARDKRRARMEGMA